MLYNEMFQWRVCWPYIKQSHDYMVSIANKKNDEDMNDEEFNVKYASFRHEIGRAALFSRKLITNLNRFMHYIELYVIYGGPKKLAKRILIYKPIFIIGDFRSGTSVLERLISHHPNVVYFQMSHSIVWSAPYLWHKFLGW